MATWFARQNNVNINAANVWNSEANGSGSWLTWPAASGDILVCNGNIINVNVSTNLGSGELQNDTRSGATSGGQFRLNTTGVSLTANAFNIGGNSSGIVRVTLVSGTVYFVGNLYGSSVGNAPGMLIGVGIGATLNFTGNIYAGDGAGAYGINPQSAHTGAVNITGNVYGSDAGQTAGFFHQSTGVVTITGNVFGGNAINSNGVKVANTGTGMTITGYSQASTVSAGAQNDAQGVLTIGETRSASNGRGAVLGAFRFASATAAVSKPIIAGIQQTLSVLDVAALVPAEADVRAGVTYGDGAYTGTLPPNRKRISMAGRF